MEYVSLRLKTADVAAVPQRIKQQTPRGSLILLPTAGEEFFHPLGYTEGSDGRIGRHQRPQTLSLATNPLADRNGESLLAGKGR